MAIRYLCREVDHSPTQAGAPVVMLHLTFEDAINLESWLREDLPLNRYGKWVHRELIGIELLTQPAVKHK